MSSLGTELSGMDLSGKLILKAQLGEDIRRIPIHNEDMTYDELVLMMQRVFRGSLKSEDELIIKYKDEDGDLITIFDSSDLAFAIQSCRVLRLTLIVNGSSSFKDSRLMDDYTLRQELRHIRDRVTALLDCFETNSHLGKGDFADGYPPVNPALENSASTTTVVSSHSVNCSLPKEFDPLQDKEATKRANSAEQSVVSGSDSASSTPAPTGQVPSSNNANPSPAHGSVVAKSNAPQIPQHTSEVYYNNQNYEMMTVGRSGGVRPMQPGAASHPYPYIYQYPGYGPVYSSNPVASVPPPGNRGPASVPHYQHAHSYQGWHQ